MGRQQTARLIYSVTCFEHINSRGIKLQAYKYAGPGAKATVFFHHGYSEHAGWYKRLFTMLVEHGYNVVAYDVHGHGQSEPLDPHRRALILHHKHLLDDAHDFLRTVVLPFSGALPVYGAAHSLGGGVLTLIEAERPGTFAALALNAPALGHRTTWVVLFLLVFAGLLLSIYGPAAMILPGTPWEKLSDDKSTAKRVASDTRYYNAGVRLSTALSMCQLMFHVTKSAPKVRCPLYVQWPAEDRLVCRNSALAFVARCGSPDVTWHEIKDPGAMHVMIHGFRGVRLVRLMVQYLERVHEGLVFQHQPPAFHGRVRAKGL